MIIQAIKRNGSEKLLAIAQRDRDGNLSPFLMCDWNTVPNTLRIFSFNSSINIKFGSFRECVKYIFSK